MRCFLKEDIEIPYEVTEDALFNLSIIQKYLSRYLGIYPINIKAEKVSSKRQRKSASIMPFSGGIDSCFALLHSKFVLGKRVDAGVHVLGLDLSDAFEYEKSKERCQKILDFAEAKLLPFQTNVRSSLGSFFDWRLQSDFVLASILHFFEGDYGSAIIAGGGDGNDLTIGDCFGSPFLNERLFHLFSNDVMQVDSHEGEVWERIKKLDYIAQFEVVRENLRVCWASKKHGNCGQCTNCVVGQLAFLASIGEIPPCFPVKFTDQSLSALFRRASEIKTKDNDSDAVLVPKKLKNIISLSEKKGNKSEFIERVKAFCGVVFL
jgi:hypothetical protein